MDPFSLFFLGERTHSCLEQRGRRRAKGFASFFEHVNHALLLEPALCLNSTTFFTLLCLPLSSPRAHSFSPFMLYFLLNSAIVFLFSRFSRIFAHFPKKNKFQSITTYRAILQQEEQKYIFSLNHYELVTKSIPNIILPTCKFKKHANFKSILIISIHFVWQNPWGNTAHKCPVDNGFCLVVLSTFVRHVLNLSTEQK